MTRPELSIGMAVYDDFQGAYFTVNALRLYHSEVMSRCELIVVDNNPRGKESNRLRGFLGWVSGGQDLTRVRYVPYEEVQGTAAPRDLVFRLAEGKAALCLDSHILLYPGSLARLLDYYRDNPETPDLLSGPMIYDDLKGYSTHFDDVWRGGMWGTWGADERGQGEESFEIGAMGLGIFTCRKDAWLGFNSRFREFGGEEWYIHEKYRQAGARCLCLPWLKWVHRFNEGQSYPRSIWGKVRNYVLGLTELGLPLDRLYRHFVEGLNEDGSPWPQGHRQANLITPEQWQILTADPTNPPERPPQAKPQVVLDRQSKSQKQGCGSCNKPRDLEAWYAKARDTPSDINEHVPTLREYASKSDVVVEFGVRRGVSTVALLAGQPKELASYDLHTSAEVGHLTDLMGQTRFRFVQGDSRAVEPIPCDLLFIDTQHTAEQLYAELSRHAPACRKWIMMHDTVIFGERGEDGGPGLLPAVRRYLRENPEWSVKEHHRNNHGLLVLTRLKEEKKPLPPLWKQGVNAARASWRAGANVLTQEGPFKDTETQDKRMALCLLCPSNNKGRCSECGCPILKKTSWPSEVCPLGVWHAEEVA